MLVFSSIVIGIALLNVIFQDSSIIYSRIMIKYIYYSQKIDNDIMSVKRLLVEKLN